MFDNYQFRKSILIPSLQAMNSYSPDAEELLVATMAHESLGGTFFEQTNGPALGIYQMEPATYHDIWKNFLPMTSVLGHLVLGECKYSVIPDPTEMIWNLRFATMMARVHYDRVMAPLPASNDINAIWDYYKSHYNSSMGAAQKNDFINHYNTFIRGK